MQKWVFHAFSRHLFKIDFLCPLIVLWEELRKEVRSKAKNNLMVAEDVDCGPYSTWGGGGGE